MGSVGYILNEVPLKSISLFKRFDSLRLTVDGLLLQFSVLEVTFPFAALVPGLILMKRL